MPSLVVPQTTSTNYIHKLVTLTKEGPHLLITLIGIYTLSSNSIRIWLSPNIFRLLKSGLRSVLFFPRLKHFINFEIYSKQSPQACETNFLSNLPSVNHTYKLVTLKKEVSQLLIILIGIYTLSSIKLGFGFRQIHSGCIKMVTSTFLFGLD